MTRVITETRCDERVFVLYFTVYEWQRRRVGRSGQVQQIFERLYTLLMVVKSEEIHRPNILLPKQTMQMTADFWVDASDCCCAWSLVVSDDIIAGPRCPMSEEFEKQAAGCQVAQKRAQRGDLRRRT